MKQLFQWKTIIVVILTFSAFFLSAAEFVIAENGKANAEIVIPRNAPGVVKFAADELKTHLDRMTGCKFIITDKPSQGNAICLGFGTVKDLPPDSSVISIRGNQIDIYGKDNPSPKKPSLFTLYFDEPERGTLMGVYEFLDRLGVRWPAPGEKWTHIPRKTTLKVPEGTQTIRPAFQDRQISNIWNFMSCYPDAKKYADGVDELYRWGLRLRSSTRGMVCGCHSEHSLKLYENKEWANHPERFQLQKDGTRNRNYLCWTDPAVKEIWWQVADAYFSGKKPQDIGLDLSPYIHSKWPWPFISADEIMIDPYDHTETNDGRCMCQRCNEFRKKFPSPDDTEIIWRAIADVAEKVRKKYPGKYISTLIYPPKKQMPKFSKLPDNIRVRICISGPKECATPQRLKQDLNLVAQWAKLLGRENLPLWTYQCASFARTLPGVPDTYPRLTAEFIRNIRPISAGMYLENHAPTHTFHNMDVYLFSRMIWDPSRDIEKEQKEYFEIFYGPAAKEAGALFRRLESNWIRLWRENTTNQHHDSIGMWSANKQEIQKAVWSGIYSQKEMKTLDDMVGAVEKAAADDPVYARRAALLRPWLLNIMKAERSEVMEKEDRRKLISLPVPVQSFQEFPSGEQWSKAPVYPLISAIRTNPVLEAGGSFQVLASDRFLCFRIRFLEPKMNLSATDATRKSGDAKLWMDNVAELFFHAEKSKKFWQIIFNDNGAWSSQTKGRVLSRWTPMPGIKVKTFRGKDFWICEAAIPLKELQIDGGELRFNLTRERNIRGQKTEFSTWSPLAMMGNWHAPENYGTVHFKQGNP